MPPLEDVDDRGLLYRLDGKLDGIADTVKEIKECLAQKADTEQLDKMEDRIDDRVNGLERRVDENSKEFTRKMDEKSKELENIRIKIWSVAGLFGAVFAVIEVVVQIWLHVTK